MKPVPIKIVHRGKPAPASTPDPPSGKPSGELRSPVLRLQDITLTTAGLTIMNDLTRLYPERTNLSVSLLASEALAIIATAPDNPGSRSIVVLLPHTHFDPRSLPTPSSKPSPTTSPKP